MPPWEKYKSEDAPAEGPWSKYGGSATAEAQPTAAPEQKASLADKMVGGWGGRMAMGMASPVLAATQLLGGEKGRAAVAELDAMKKRGMASEGSDGYDFYGLMGSMVPGAGITKGMTAALPAASNAIGRIGTGAAIGAATSAAQPTAPSDDFWGDTAKKIGVGGLVGGVIPAIGSAISAMRGAPQLNPTKAATLAEGRADGYVVQPSKVNPSFITNRLESIAGKAAVGQDAAKRNQEITNALAAKALGLPKDTNIGEPGLLDGFRKEQGKVYEQISSLSGDAKSALNELKQARHDAKVQWNFFNKSGNPDALTAAKNADALSEMATDELGREAREAGKSELVKALEDARTKIAKSYDIGRALNTSSGEVNAQTIGKILAKRKEGGMTGELATIGKMANSFKDVMREGGNVPSPGVSGTDAAMSAVLGVAGGAGMGPAGIVAGGLPLLRGPARNLVLSPAYQKFATSDPAKFNEIVRALAQQGAGAAGTTVGRLQ